MAVDAGSTFVSVRIRLDELKKDISKVERELKGLGSESATNSKKFQKNWKQSFAAFSLAAGIAFIAIAKLSKELISAASIAEETEAKFQTVFDGIGGAANDAATNLTESFGQSRQGAQQLLGDVGDILTGFGFTKEASLGLAESVATLGVDLASFTNFAGGAEGATAALTKALLGEAESVKALGIVIRQDTDEYKNLVAGIQESQGVSLVQAKALAALQIATEQSKNAIGDFARTQDSFANRSRTTKAAIEDLKSALGTQLLPTATRIVTVFGDLVRRLADTKIQANEVRNILNALGAGEGVSDTSTALSVLQDELDATFESLVKQQDIFGRFKERNVEIVRTIFDEAAAQGILADESEGLFFVYQQLEQAIKDLTFAQNRQLTVEELIANSQAASIKALADRAEAARRAADEETELAAQAELRRLAVAEEKGGLIAAALKAEIFAEQEAVLAALAAEQEKREARKASARARRDEEQALTDFLKEQEDERKQAFVDNTFAILGSFSAMFSAIDSLADASANSELERLRVQIESTEQGTAERIALEEEFDRRSKELQRENARREKAASIFSATISTAQAIIGFLANPGGIPGIILSALAGFTGAAQIAAIASQPLPSFAGGGVALPRAGGTQAIVAENGSAELLLNAGTQGEALLNAFAERIAEAGGGNQTITVPLIVDGIEMARAVVDRINRRETPVNQSSMVASR